MLAPANVFVYVQGRGQKKWLTCVFIRSVYIFILYIRVIIFGGLNWERLNEIAYISLCYSA